MLLLLGSSRLSGGGSLRDNRQKKDGRSMGSARLAMGGSDVGEIYTHGMSGEGLTEPLTVEAITGFCGWLVPARDRRQRLNPGRWTRPRQRGCATLSGRDVWVGREL